MDIKSLDQSIVIKAAEGVGLERTSTLAEKMCQKV